MQAGIEGASASRDTFREMSRRLRRCALALVTLSCLTTIAACGTRLPDSDFAVQGVVVNGPSGAPDSGTALPGASAGPSASPTAGPSSGPHLLENDGGVTIGSGGDAPQGAGAAGNTASDIGVTPTTIRLGLVASVSNPFDPATFVGPLYGAQAFFYDLNQRGGIHGRTIQLSTCDDHGDGSRNQTCIHGLIDDTKVFGFASNSIFKYDAASYVNSKGVPDIGSQPIDNAYNQYPHMWDLFGETYPRDGKQIGYKGKLEEGTEPAQYFKQKFPSTEKKAGVLYYNQATSERYGQSIANGLKAQGYTVVTEQINFALPNFDSAVLDMKAKGVRFVFDALDSGGNQNLCAAMDSGGLSDQIVAKVTTAQSWVASVGTDFSSSPKCRNKIFATGNTQNYEDIKHPEVKRFRDAMARLHLDGPNQMSEWALEGWAGAQWMADAIESCGAKVTRVCVEAYMQRPVDYIGHGLLSPRNFTKYPPRDTVRDCINVARWQDSANGGKGGWVSQVPDLYKNCFTGAQIKYDA